MTPRPAPEGPESQTRREHPTRPENQTRPDPFDRAVARVLTADTCSGCGACALINPDYAMRLNAGGYNRPVKTGRTPFTRTELAARTADFEASCPGRRVDSPTPPGATDNGFLGPVVSSWQAWSTDPEQRFRGSSGGTLTALAAWLLSTGRTSRVVGAQSDPAQPARTVPVVLRTRAEVRDTAGSRYAPVSIAGDPAAGAPDSTVIGKPCEASALRQLGARQLSARPPAAGPDPDGTEPPHPAQPTRDAPLLLSFFCAGVPSQRSTEHLIEALGIAPGTPLRSVRYRGHGWPGDFTAETTAGQHVTASYDDSWGGTLGPTVQWRCKICPDGMGNSADIVAGDFWRTDARGYPTFDASDGISALLARTPRGHAVLLAARAAGVIHAEPLDVAAIAAIQPLQISRRRTLFGRLLGRALAGHRVPRYRGFALLRTAVAHPLENARFAYGSFRRSLRRRPAAALNSAPAAAPAARPRRDPP